MELLVDYVESTIIAGLLCENRHCRKIKKLKNEDYSLKNRSRNILEIAMQNSSKISEIRCQNGAKITPKSIKILSKNRGPKKKGQKSSKIDPSAPEGRKGRCEPPAGLPFLGRVVPTNNKKNEDCIQVIPHARGPKARRIF